MTTLMGIAAAAIVAFTLITAVRVARADIPQKKRWVFFALIGVGSLSYTSASGDFGLNPLSFQILGAGFMGEFPGGPFLFKISFPLGAILALRHLKASPYLAEADEGPTSE